MENAATRDEKKPLGKHGRIEFAHANGVERIPLRLLPQSAIFPDLKQSQH